jgi:putative SOS response-associated peptidase YedK
VAWTEHRCEGHPSAASRLGTALCGRFTSSQRREAIAERFQVAAPEAYSERYNLAPPQRALIIREHNEDFEAIFARWGLLPHLG